jgi:hypothetical protein
MAEGATELSPTSEPPPLLLSLRRVLRPGEFEGACPLFPASVPACYYGSLDLERDTEAAAEDAELETPLRDLLGRELLPGAFAGELLVFPAAPLALPPSRAVFLWRSAWRGTVLEDDALLSAPPSQLTAILGFAPGRVVALLGDRIRLQRNLATAPLVASQLLRSSAYASPFSGIASDTLRVLVAGLIVVGVAAVLALAIYRRRRTLLRRRYDDRSLAARPGPLRWLLWAGIALAALAAAGLAMLGAAAAAGGSRFASALRARDDPENFFAPRLPPALLALARELRVPEIAGAEVFGEEEGSPSGTPSRLRRSEFHQTPSRLRRSEFHQTPSRLRRSEFLQAGRGAKELRQGQGLAPPPSSSPLFDASASSGTISGIRLGKNVIREGDVGLRFASPAMRRRFFLLEAPLAETDAARLVAGTASGSALLSVRVTPTGPLPAQVLVTLVPIETADERPSQGEIDVLPNGTLLEFAVQARLTNLQTLMLLFGFSGEGIPRAGNSTALHFPGVSSFGLWEQARRNELAVLEAERALLRAQPGTEARARARQTLDQAKFRLCSTNIDLRWTTNDITEGKDAALTRLGFPLCGIPSTLLPASADVDAPFVSRSPLRGVLLASLACPPGSARHLSPQGTLAVAPSGLTFERSMSATDGYSLPGPEGEVLVFERDPGAASNVVRIRDREGRYLAPPVNCSPGTPQKIDLAEPPPAEQLAPTLALRTSWIVRKE